MRILTAVAVLSVVGCGNPTAPSESLTGTWTTAQVDVLFGVTFDLKADGGTWRGTVAGHSGPSAGLVTDASLNGDAVAFTMEPTAHCGYGGYVLNLTLAGNRATGTATRMCGSSSGYSLPVTVYRQ